MKMKIIFIVLVFSSSLIIAQRKVADNFFNKYSYVKASELYEEAYRKGDSSKYVLERLGDCYYNNSDSENAAKWLGKLVELYPKKIEEDYLLKYVQAQQSLGNYKESDKLLETLNESYRKSSGKIEELISTDSNFVEIKNLDINSEFSDFGLFVQDNKVLFASTKTELTDTKNRLYGWNNEPYLDLYQADVNDNNEFSNIQLIPAQKINTKYHESSAVVTNDGNTLYFTRVNVNKRNKLNFDEEGTTHLKLYKATLEGDEWGSIEELDFNDDHFSTGHPALSPDNRKLYFISDREGGYGKTDIYYVDVFQNNEYGTPVNLGDNVNTKGREMFPFVAADNTLYFSSDNNINIGLLDIFKTDIINDEDALPENLGAPYNSRDDDFGFSINKETQRGYFSSNRDGGKGSDDIYSYQVIPCTQKIKGTVRNRKSNELLKDAIIKLIDKRGKIIKEIKSNTMGEFVFVDVSCDASFTVLATKDDYKDDQKEVTTSQLKDDDTIVELSLVPLINDCEITLNPIFFDFDKWNIRTDSKVELENIVDIMRNNTDMKLNIESHTDMRGTGRYNLKLSNRRAIATRDYLVSRGINSNRFLSVIGYGETRPINDCSEKGVRCSEEKHQKNRRSHFYIDGCE